VGAAIAAIARADDLAAVVDAVGCTGTGRRLFFLTRKPSASSATSVPKFSILQESFEL
jgi:hypothetical protein